MTPTQAQIDKADKLAVQIVTLVCKRICNGKLYVYDGIEAAREIRQLILSEML